MNENKIKQSTFLKKHSRNKPFLDAYNRDGSYFNTFQRQKPNFDNGFQSPFKKNVDVQKTFINFQPDFYSSRNEPQKVIVNETQTQTASSQFSNSKFPTLQPQLSSFRKKMNTRYNSEMMLNRDINQTQNSINYPLPIKSQANLVMPVQFQ